MNKRSREILSQLITKTEYSQTISIQELADMFKVSSRTIRYDIDQINDYLKENHLQPLNLGKRGVINTEPDITKARESLSEEGFYSFKLTREERVSFAAVLMICSDDYITLSEIADQLFVSRSTVIHGFGTYQNFLQRETFICTFSFKQRVASGRKRDR